MTAQPTDPQPIASLDDDVNAYLDLTERMEELESQRATIRARLAQRGPGTHTTTTGTKVTVTAPNRRFNRAKALTMLTPEQQQTCMALDDKLIKAQLPPVLLEGCMDEGTGAPRVTVK